MRKTLIKILSMSIVLVIMLITCSACGGSSGENKPIEQSEIQAIYNLYVANAETSGETPLSYEEWLASIKGEKGDSILSITIDSEGRLIITLTNGTVLEPIVLPVKVGLESEAQRLQYQKIEGKEEYKVVGIGLYSDLDLVIPSTYNGLPVTEIADGAFANGEESTALQYIKSITIEEGIKVIGEEAFEYCYNVESISLPNSLISIGEEAFYKCYNIAKVNYTGDINQWVQIEFAYFYANPLPYGAKLYINNVLVTEANITTATKISDYAFSNCDSLTSVTIGNSVTSIGDVAFYDCSSLQSITIPNSVTSIGYSAFYSCDSLESVTFTDTANWYKTDNYGNWKNKTGGELIDVTNPTYNKNILNNDYYFYKI